jgi:hypothetical protein
LQIAAIALANDCVLVTHNTGEFSRIAGLKLEVGLVAMLTNVATRGSGWAKRARNGRCIISRLGSNGAGCTLFPCGAKENL